MLKQLAWAALILGAWGAAGRLDAKVVEESIEIAVEVADVRGRIVRQPIKVAVFRDDTRERAPFLILNHGRAAEAAKRETVRAAQYAANARYFVAQGYAVFLPVRMGYGASGGPDVENSGPCNARAYRQVYEAGAAQSIAVIAHAKTLPYVDPTRGIVVGQSFGGATAIALAAKNLPGVLAAVNFAGGGGGRPGTHPAQPCSVDRMTALFASYGTTARIPTLWLYSENDQYWGPAIPRAWHKAFTDRGGIGEFVQLPPYKGDGHPSFTGNRDVWKPAFEAFAQACCQGKLTAAQQPPPSARDRDAFTRVLAAWAAKHKIKQAVIVVRHGGRVVHEAGIGGGDPSKPVLLASLSKAITGACVATLVRDGKLGFDWPLSRALAQHFAAHGRPPDARIERITIGQLLIHRAGFASAADGEDPATRSVLEAYLANHSTREAPKPDYVTMLLQARLAHDPGQAFAYSNAGYMTLGAVIEEATGETYERYCREKVLKSVGASAVLDPTWGVLWSAGGWRMSGADYLAFLEQLDPGRATFGTRTRAWMLDGSDKTYGTARPQSWYGPGIRMRSTGRGLELWHTGTWRRRLGPDTQGPRSAETCLLAVQVADGTSWFVHAVPVVLGGARNELDRELLGAYRSVRRWD